MSDGHTTNRKNPSRNFIFTFFDISAIDKLRGVEDERVRYLIFQHERGGTTGRDHLQGYVEFRNTVRIAQAQRILGIEGGHLEPRRGTRAQAIDYCRKEETRVAGPWEVGQADLQPGKRNDLLEIKSRLDQGASSKDISDEFFGSWVRHHRSFDLYRELHSSVPVRRDIRTFVLWGPSGTGKTHRAVGHRPDDHWILNRPATANQPLYFDGYRGEGCLIIDEFYGWIRYDFLLRILDCYRLELQCRGRYSNAKWTQVFLTSNVSPERWYPALDAERLPALMRRLTHIVEVKSKDQPIIELSLQ